MTDELTRAADDAVDARLDELDPTADEAVARGAPADRADRGRPRGAAVRRRAAAVAARDRGARRHGPRDRRRPARRPRGLAARRAASGCCSTATASSSRPRPRAARSSPATSAPTRSGCPRRRSRRSRSSPTASRSRRPPSSASAASTRTTRSGRCCTAGWSSSWAASDAPGRPFLYGTGFEFLERFGLTSLEELPPLDVDVAARLAEEGGETVHRAGCSPRPATTPPLGRRSGPAATASD